VNGAVTGGARTYEIKWYRPLMFASLAATTLIFGTLAVSATIGRNFGVALVLLVAFAVFLVVGVRAQQRTAVRLTVSTAGLDVRWIFGAYHVPWQRVRRIRFLRSRWGSGRIERVDVLIVGDRPLQLFGNLSQFDQLVAQLHEMQPNKVDE
jgi:hypothetical protein